MLSDVTKLLLFFETKIIHLKEKNPFFNIIGPITYFLDH